MTGPIPTAARFDRLARQNWRAEFASCPGEPLTEDELHWLEMPPDAEDEFRHSGRAERGPESRGS